jgi:integrase
VAVRTYKDAHGRTRYLVEFQQRGNRVVRRTPPGTRLTEAKDLEAKLRGEIFAEVDLGRKPEISLEEALFRWLRDTNAHKKDQRHPRQNAEILAPFVAGKSLRQVAEAAQNASRTMRTSRLSTATVNRRLCVLKAAAKHAWRQGWIDENLSGRISLLPEDNKREVYLSAEDVRRLARASPSPAAGTAILLAAYTGLRASELLALPSMPRGSTREGSLTVAHSKTGKPRVVPLPGPVRHLSSALPLGLSYSQLRREFLVAREAAGMPHVRFHDLRHSCASMLINAGVDLYTVGAILGHSAPITTARYSHLSQATLKKAMSKLK